MAIDHFSNRVSYTLDDFSGHTIECVCKAPLKPEPPKLDSPDASKAAAKAAEINDPMISPDGPKLKGIDVCSIVKIKGAISVFRDVRQIAMKRIHVISDTAAEVAEWKKRSAFMRDVLRVPWVVTEEQEKKCLRNAEREKWKEEERKKRKIKEGETAEERKVRKRREKAAKREKEKVRVEEEKKQMVVDERKEREVWLREQTLMRERRKRELERRRAAM